MAVNRTRPGPLSFIGAFLLLVTAVAGFAAAGPNVKLWLTALREPVTLQPELPSPLPPLLLLALLVVTALAVGRSFTERGGSRALAGAVYGLGLGLVFLRLAAGPMVPPTASPTGAAREAAEVVEGLAGRIDGALREAGRLPDAAALAALADGDSPWRSHGRLLPYRVVVETGAGPRLTGRPGDLPGTIYCVTAAGGTRYWLTALVLDGAPTGHLDFLRRADGTPRIVTHGKR